MTTKKARTKQKVKPSRAELRRKLARDLAKWLRFTAKHKANCLLYEALKRKKSDNLPLAA